MHPPPVELLTRDKHPLSRTTIVPSVSLSKHLSLYRSISFSLSPYHNEAEWLFSESPVKSIFMTTTFETASPFSFLDSADLPRPIRLSLHYAHTLGTTIEHDRLTFVEQFPFLTPRGFLITLPEILDRIEDLDSSSNMPRSAPPQHQSTSSDWLPTQHDFSLTRLLNSLSATTRRWGKRKRQVLYSGL